MRPMLEPITKVTLNLYTRDVDWLKDKYPIGYTEQIREIIRQHILYEKTYGSSDFGDME